MADINWTEAQIEAITASGSNILVSAAAGSGKTAVLVERVIRMITREEDPVDIDRLLVMTFTRAAAAQMKSKIYTALRTRLLADPENVRLRHQLMKVPNARICTIDSLCAEIVRDHIEDTELDPGYRIADEAEISMLKKDVLEQVMEDMYAEASPEFLDFAEYYMDKNDKKLDEIVLTLFRYAQSHPEPEPWLRGAVLPYINAGRMGVGEDCLPYPEEMSDWVPIYVELIASKIAEIRSMAEQGIRIACMNYGPAPYEDLFRDILEFTDSLEGQCCDYRRSALNELIEDWKKAPPIKKNEEVDEDLKVAAQELRTEIKKRLVEIRDNLMYDDLEIILQEMAQCAPVAQTIADLTIRFSRAFTQAKRERKIADFSDIAHDALRILIQYNDDGEILRDEHREPLYTETADLMSRDIDEVIVDEYQDTNTLQEYLVGALSRERFGQPNVFMVGDVKQSIYGFRMACPELFTGKYNRYAAADADTNAGVDGAADAQSAGGDSDVTNTAGRLIILDRNYRSRKEILDFTNLVFSRTMIEPVGEIDYRNGHSLAYGELYGPIEEPEPAFVPEVYLLQGTGEQGKYLEAYKIAERIEALVADGEYDLSDIVILTRSTDNPQLEKVLYQRGIPVIKSSGKGFFDSLEIRLVLDLLKIIDNPFQDIPFTAVLYSPLLSASAEDLAQIRLAGSGNDGMYECLRKYVEARNGSGDSGQPTGDSGQPAGDSEQPAGAMHESSFAWFLDRLEIWRQKATYMGVYDFLEYVLDDSGLYHILTAMPQGADRRANIEFLKAKAGTFAKGSYTGLFQFIRYIAELQENDIDFGSMTAATGAKAVRMMTIHKSKGLEFPVVILAVGGKEYNKTDMNSSVVPDRRMGLGLEYRDPATRMIRRTVLMQTIRERQKISTYAEEMRLLYVAMTRAKKKLIITGTDRFLETHCGAWEKTSLGQVRFGGSAAGGQQPGVFGGAAISQLPSYEIMQASSFLVLLGLAVYPFRELDGFYLECLKETDIEEERVEEVADLQEAREQLLRLASGEVCGVTDVIGETGDITGGATFNEAGAGPNSATDLESIRQALEYEYPYLKATQIQGKITASQLENREDKDAADGQNETSGAQGETSGTQDETSGTQTKSPAKARTKTTAKKLREKALATSLSEEEMEQLTGAERGNAYHRFLELVDYQAVSGEHGIEEQLQKLEESGKLSAAYARAVDPTRIRTFLGSEIGQRMANAFAEGRLFRERQFVMGSVVDINQMTTKTGPAISSDVPDEELLLVQGIIDAYFIEQDDAGKPHIILVDYKTDANRDEQHYIDTYTPQLAAYADALEKSTGLTVAERIIYSLELGKEIRC